MLIGAESPIERLQLQPEYHGLAGGNSDEDVVDISNFNHDNTVLIHNTRPAAVEKENILLIHSNRDRVISSLQIKQLAESWALPESSLHVLRTHSIAETLGEIGFVL